jgi:hypothetical protein
MSLFIGEGVILFYIIFFLLRYDVLSFASDEGVRFRDQWVCDVETVRCSAPEERERCHQPPRQQTQHTHTPYTTPSRKIHHSHGRYINIYILHRLHPVRQQAPNHTHSLTHSHTSVPATRCTGRVRFSQSADSVPSPFLLLSVRHLKELCN